MEVVNSGKHFSRSNKSGSSKVSSTSITDAKQRRSKRRKKNRQNSDKSETETQDAIKFINDEEKGLDLGSGSSSDQTTNLPWINDSSKSSGSNGRVSPRDPEMSFTRSTVQGRPSSSLDEAMVNSVSQRIAFIKPVSRSRQNKGIKHTGNKSQLKEKISSKSTSSMLKAANSDASSLSFSTATKPNESLRWDNSLEDSEEECERIRLYKLNRRKRYLAAAQAKGLGWAVNYTVNSAFQISDEVGLDNMRAGLYSDYTSIPNVHASREHSIMRATMVEC